MVKGVNDKQSGFWMYLERIIRPELERKLGKRLKGPELQCLGKNYWAALSYEEKEEWKTRAKEFNKSEAGQCEKMFRRIEYRNRKHTAGEPTNMTAATRQWTSQKLKPSNIIPPSRRYDEVDEYSRKYFGGVDDDFEGMRDHHRKEFIDKYQWKFAQKEPAIKEIFFVGSVITVVTANVYYEDSCTERMVPSEISILKFSIKHGIYDQRHYILGYGEREIPNEICKKDAEEIERATGLLMNSDEICANVRFDYAQVWDEIKAFTGIDGEGTKLLVLSDDWNTVVGSFDALFTHAREKSFSRIETRFATLEDFFMAVYATVRGVRISDFIKLSVSAQMRERWAGAEVYDLVTCDFHAEMRYETQCRARSCSLFAAHEAAFNFFTLCKKYAFPTYEFTGKHMPDKASLPEIEEDFLKCKPQRPHFRSSVRGASNASMRNMPPELPVPSLSSEKQPLKSILRKSSLSVCHGRNIQPDASRQVERETRSAYNVLVNEEDDDLASMADLIEIRYDVERWLQEQRTVPQENGSEMDFLPRNPHLTSTSTVVDKCSVPTDQQLIWSSQILPVSFNQPYQEVSLDPCQTPAEIDSSRSGVPSNCQHSSGGTRFSNVVSSADAGSLLPNNERDQALIDLGPIDNDSDTEMFSNVSIPASLHREIPATGRLGGGDQNELLSKRPNNMRHNSPPSSHQIQPTATHGALNNTLNQRVTLYDGAPISQQLSPQSTVTQHHPFPSKQTTNECCRNPPTYAQKASCQTLPATDLIPDRTPGGFCIPNVYQTISPGITKKNRSSMTSASSGEMGTRSQAVITDQICKRAYESSMDMKASGRILNGTTASKNPYTSSESLAEITQEENLTRQRTAVSSIVEHEQGLISPNQVQNSVFILEPLTYKEAKMFGWSANMQESDAGREFARWLDSVNFESDLFGGCRRRFHGN